MEDIPIIEEEEDEVVDDDEEIEAKEGKELLDEESLEDEKERQYMYFNEIAEAVAPMPCLMNCSHHRVASRSLPNRDGIS